MQITECPKGCAHLSYMKLPFSVVSFHPIASHTFTIQSRGNYGMMESAIQGLQCLNQLLTS